MIQTKIIRGQQYFKNVQVEKMPKRVKAYFEAKGFEHEKRSSYFYDIDMAINDWIIDNPDKEIIQIHYAHVMSVSDNNGDEAMSALIEYETKESTKEDDLEAASILISIRSDLEKLSMESDTTRDKVELEMIKDCIDRYLEKLK